MTSTKESKNNWSHVTILKYYLLAFSAWGYFIIIYLLQKN